MKKIDLRKEAKDRDCMVRLPGICNFNPETTVLAHYRKAGISGIGQKSPDLIGAWACSACHDEIDRRTRNVDFDTVELAHLQGMARTLYVLFCEGKI